MSDKPRFMSPEERLAGMAFVIHEQRSLIEETSKIMPLGEERVARYHSFLAVWMRLRELESTVAPMMPKARQEYLEQDAERYRLAHEEEMRRWRREYGRRKRKN